MRMLFDQTHLIQVIVSVRLGHSSVIQALDTYTADLSHLQELASKHLEDMIFRKTDS